MYGYIHMDIYIYKNIENKYTCIKLYTYIYIYILIFDGFYISNNTKFKKLLKYFLKIYL